jgi:hypothetical protein
MTRTMLLAVTLSLIALPPAAGEEDTPAPLPPDPARFAGSAGLSAGLSLGRLTGLSLGGTARFLWRPWRRLYMEASVSARGLIGSDYSFQAAVLTPLFQDGCWSLEAGIALGVSYESKMIGYTQDDPVPTGGVYGPYWAVTGLLVVAPLHFSWGRLDMSLFRLGLGAETGAWMAAPLFSLDAIEIILNLGG